MAKNLSKSGISTTQTIEAWHVTQSIDAFTGADAYNINLSGSLEVTGSSKLSGSVILNDITQPTVDGTEFMVLRTDGSGNLTFDYADRTQLEIRTDEAVSKGDPLYITGFNSGQNRIAVAKADAADSNKMPAIALAYENVGMNTNTQAVTVGSLDDVNTQTAPNDFQEGDVLYVKAGGGLTNVKPTGSALIQNVGKVGRRNTNNGEIVVFAIGRSNDVPNISPGYFWVGNSDSVATAVPTSSISVTPPTLQQVTDQGSSTTTAITASIISASNTVFISASLLDPSAHVLTVDTSSGQVFYTPFEISSSGGGNVIGSPLKPLKLDGSTVTAQSTSTFDIKSTQTNFQKADGTTMAFIDNTTGDAQFGTGSVYIKAKGEISSSKQLITSDGPDVEDLLMILSPPSANFDDTGSAAVNVNLSGSISASNAYALKLTSPDDNTFGIKADGSILSGDVSGSGVSTASFGTYLGDGSQLTGIETDPFPYSGSAIISGSTELIGPVNITGSLFVEGSDSLLYVNGDDDIIISSVHDVIVNSANLIVTSSNHTTFKSPNGFNVVDAQSINLGDNLTTTLELETDTLRFNLPSSPSVGDVVVAQDVNGNIKFTASSAVGDAFPFTGDATITGSLTISGSFEAFKLDADDIVLGSGAGEGMTSSDQNNIIIGTKAVGSGNIDGIVDTIAIGHAAGENLTTGDNNILIGSGSGAILTTGYSNIMIGDQTDASTNDTYQSIVIGQAASITGGTSGIAIGRNAVGSNTSVVIGGSANSNSAQTVTIGPSADSNAARRVDIGQSAEGNGYGGIAIGYSAISNAGTGVAIGYSFTNTLNNSFQWGNGGGQKFTVTTNTNVLLNNLVDPTAATHFDDSATNVITIGTGSAPDANVAHSVQLYAQTGSSEAGLQLRTSGGKIHTLADKIDFTDATAISGSTFSGSFVGDGSQLTNIPNIPTSQSIYYTADTPDQDIFNDGKIYIKLNDAATDDIQAEVLVNPSSGDVTFTWESAGGSPTSGGTALNTGDAITTLNGNFGDYDKMSLTVYAPGDTSYPYYEFLFTKGAAGTNFATRYNKWDSLP